MKLFTKPRPNILALLRPGDQLAIRRDNGRLIDTELGYADADMSDQVRWVVVHDVEPAALEALTVHHTLGSETRAAGQHVITRESIDLDPWSYVTRAPESLEVPIPRAPESGKVAPAQ